MTNSTNPKELLCIGHRGAMGHAPENTLKSIRTAMAMGAACVEIDVYYVDDRLVVIHDDRLDRTTNGTGYVLERSFGYIRSLDAGDGERVPTLEEIFATVNRKAGVNIELKGPDTAAPVAAFIAQMREAGWKDDLILVSSFNHSELHRMHRIDPAVKIGILVDEPPKDMAPLAVSLNAYSIHPALHWVDRPLVDQAHALDLKVLVYTVNRTKDILRMLNLGADGIFTNFPDKVFATAPSSKPVIGWP